MRPDPCAHAYVKFVTPEVENGAGDDVVKSLIMAVGSFAPMAELIQVFDSFNDKPTCNSQFPSFSTFIKLAMLANISSPNNCGY